MKKNLAVGSLPSFGLVDCSSCAKDVDLCLQEPLVTLVSLHSFEKELRKSKAETGAGQHGVATAAACALLDLECVSWQKSLRCEVSALSTIFLRKWFSNVFMSLISRCFKCFLRLETWISIEFASSDRLHGRDRHWATEAELLSHLVQRCSRSASTCLGKTKDPTPGNRTLCFFWQTWDSLRFRKTAFSYYVKYLCLSCFGDDRNHKVLTFPIPSRHAGAGGQRGPCEERQPHIEGRRERGRARLWEKSLWGQEGSWLNILFYWWRCRFCWVKRKKTR